MHPLSTAPARFIVRESEREYAFNRDASGVSSPDQRSDQGAVTR
jgi:hypothetical protein